MMKNIKQWLLGVAVMIPLWNFQAEAAPVFGRYLGVLKHDRLNQEQLVKLDFKSEKTR
jgi:hypothetical protein